MKIMHFSNWILQFSLETLNVNYYKNYLSEPNFYFYYSGFLLISKFDTFTIIFYKVLLIYKVLIVKAN